MTTEDLLYILAINVVSFLGGGFLFSYFQKKGTNLADKEDIKDLTQQIESVKNVFGIEQHRMNIFNERKLLAISEIYGYVIDIAQLLGDFKILSNDFKNLQELDSKHDHLLTKFGNIQYMILKNIIFIESPDDEKIGEIIRNTITNLSSKDTLKLLSKIDDRIVSLENTTIDPFEDNELKTIIEQWNQKMDKIKTEISSLTDNLRKDFQNALIVKIN